MSSDDLNERAFISTVMVGPCPRCGSQNTHDCFYDEEEHHPEFGECPLIKAIDDPIVGHCEECDSVFCIECAKVIGAGGERSLSNIARLAEGHSKSCPELKPQRWAEKYGSTHRLVSVQDDMVTITEHAEERIPDGTEEDEGDERTITLRLSKEAGITSEELRKKIGYYMKFSYDADEIHGVADVESDDDDDNSDTCPP
jgi:hypothetical protein